MTTLPAARRTLTLTAWELFSRLSVEKHRKETGVGLLYCTAQPYTDEMRQAGEPPPFELRPNGYDFTQANVAVWHGEQRIWALDDIGEIRGEFWLLSHLEPGHPFGEPLAIRDDVELVVREMVQDG